MKSEKLILKRNVEDIAYVIFGDARKIISIFSQEDIAEHSMESTGFDFICEIKLFDKIIQQEELEKLSKFINKEIKHPNPNTVHWLEKENVTAKKTKAIKAPNTLEKEICLPAFLDDYIFLNLGAVYAPDYLKFSKNLNLNREDVLIYLGTYFPRSFAETYSIFKNILQNQIIERTISEKDEINILDVGSGTGGNLSGLLLSIIEHFSTKKNINITAIDGNNEALIILEKIISQFRLIFDYNISLNCHYVTFESVDHLFQNAKQFLNSDLDFITSSKMINEIISNEIESYLNFYKNFSGQLAETGLLLMLDITAKVDDSCYLPILLNKQTNTFIQENGEKYMTLIPTVCAEFEDECKNECFCNNVFFVSHSVKKKDKSKIAYRVIGRKRFVLDVLSSISEKGDIIGWDSNMNPKCCINKTTCNERSAYII